MEISKWLAPNYDLKENLGITKNTERLDFNWMDIFGCLNPDEQKAFIAAYTPKNDAFKKVNLKGKELTIWKYERYVKDYLKNDSIKDKCLHLRKPGNKCRGRMK